MQGVSNLGKGVFHEKIENVRSRLVVAMVSSPIMTMTAMRLPGFAAIDSLGGKYLISQAPGECCSW